MNDSCKLIFLISQPRAGSTMLQRILGSHSQIHTHSEPWIMLHPAYALKQEGMKAEYNMTLAAEALREFHKILPSGEEDYITGIRKMYYYLYNRALEGSGKTYFLDKTPRYYFIISELGRIFPEAHFIILLRNPIGVLCSILSTWVGKNYYRLNDFKYDLVKAPQLLIDGTRTLEDKCIITHYENIVSDPFKEVGTICERIGVDFEPEIIDYGGKNLPKWKFGDRNSIYDKQKPSSDNLEKWKERLDDAQTWKFANDYLTILGREAVEELGYSYDRIMEEIGKRAPSGFRRITTLSFAKVTDDSLTGQSPWRKMMLRIRCTLGARGVVGTFVHAIRKLLGKT